MSKIALTPNAPGTGTFTIASPDSNINRTLTLPDADGALLSDTSSLSSSNLTGALPAIDGSALTGIDVTPSTAAVLTATAGASLGAVGTYAFMQNVSGVTKTAGGTIAGSGLRFADVNWSATGTPSASGTWMVVGRYSAASAGSTGALSVCLRIS